MKTVAIIQARIGSTRLPGKVLKPILGRPMLLRQLERVQSIRGIDQIVVAVPIGRKSDLIAKIVENFPGISVFRGSENDVLDRYYQAAKEQKAEWVVRITSDCPLIDAALSSEVVEQFKTNFPRYDYASNAHTRTLPRGLDTEIFTFRALETAHQEAKKLYEREHVTPYLWQNPQRFSILDLAYEQDRSSYRWTVDTLEDLELVQLIYESLYPKNPNFGFQDILELIDQRPELKTVNQHIEQKSVENHS